MMKLMNRLAHISLMISSNAEVIAAFAVVGIVFMMILPLPHVLIDTLIALNICISFLLVMLAMYLPGPLAFSTFPAVLLFTTLFRLAISITTTRMILLEADAGAIVTAFGNFVVGGNLVVGIVIFLILTVVQFLVITKGSERVAEVSARFTLDAMPGKQMSIDSDLRAGLITAMDAKNKRNELAKTNQLFGAMDGAMKFVKGDAIASIIIVFVNLIGGISIGVMQKGMAAGDAMTLYSILTIGDGLVAQIPALLISMTAGMIITRVTNDDTKESNIGRDIAEQISSQPRAWIIAGVVMMGFSFVPGMPTKTFLIFAIVTITAGLVSVLMARQQMRTGITEDGDSPANTELRMVTEDIRKFSMTRDYLLAMHPSAKDTHVANELIKLVRKTRNELVLNYGFTLPNIIVDYMSTLAEHEYQFCVSEVPVAEGLLTDALIGVHVEEDVLKKLHISCEYKNHDAQGSALLWVNAEHAERFQDKNIEHYNYLQIAEKNIRYVFQKTGPRFIGVQETQKLMAWLDAVLPELSKELQRVVSISMFSEVLQRLAIEGVSIRGFRTIAETLVEYGQTERDVGMLTDYVRIALREQICHEFSERNSLSVYLLSPDSEDLLRNSVRQTTRGGFLALDPDTRGKFIESVENLVRESITEGIKPVLLVAQDIRRYIWGMIKDEKFSIPVMSYSEVTPTIHVKPLDRIEL